MYSGIFLLVFLVFKAHWAKAFWIFDLDSFPKHKAKLDQEYQLYWQSPELGPPMPCPYMWPKQFLLVQNGFGPTKLIWTWPWWFGHDQNELVTTKLSKVQIVIFYQNESHLDLTNSFWYWPFYFGLDQIIMVKSKSIWSDQNHFGPTKTVLVT